MELEKTCLRMRALLHSRRVPRKIISQTGWTRGKRQREDVSQASGASRTHPCEILAQQSVRQRSKLRLWKARAAKPTWGKAWVYAIACLRHRFAHDRGAECSPMWPHLAASSSSSSFTNCRGTWRERTLSAICSRIRRWLPSVVGNRYMRQMAPPNTEVRTQEDRLWEKWLQTCLHGSPYSGLQGHQALFFPRKQTATTKNKNHLNQVPPSGCTWHSSLCQKTEVTLKCEELGRAHGQSLKPMSNEHELKEPFLKRSLVLCAAENTVLKNCSRQVASGACLWRSWWVESHKRGKGINRSCLPDFSKVSFRKEAYLDRIPSASVKLSSTGRTIW